MQEAEEIWGLVDMPDEYKGLMDAIAEEATQRKKAAEEAVPSSEMSEADRQTYGRKMYEKLKDWEGPEGIVAFTDENAMSIGFRKEMEGEASDEGKASGKDSLASKDPLEGEQKIMYATPLFEGRKGLPVDVSKMEDDVPAQTGSFQVSMEWTGNLKTDLQTYKREIQQLTSAIL
jgi:hypothetical protein